MHRFQQRCEMKKPSAYQRLKAKNAYLEYENAALYRMAKSMHNKEPMPETEKEQKQYIDDFLVFVNYQNREHFYNSVWLGNAGTIFDYNFANENEAYEPQQNS